MDFQESRFYQEINSWDRGEIEEECGDVPTMWLVQRYDRYRKLGLSIREACEALRAANRNEKEQRERREGHDTGYYWREEINA